MSDGVWHRADCADGCGTVLHLVSHQSGAAVLGVQEPGANAVMVALTARQVVELGWWLIEHGERIAVDG